MAQNEIKKVGVVGAGTMGSGIAQLFALYDYAVVLVDTDDSALGQALVNIRAHTDPHLWEQVEGRIRTSTALEDVREADLVIETVFEDPEVKKEILRKLSRICSRSAIIATNTSSISINELSQAVFGPSRFIGMHFMNPPKVIKLIEIVKGKKTSEETVSAVGWLAREMEKEPIVINDTPGFVSNRLLFALIGEAIRLLDSGVATKEDIDAVMKYGVQHPMGPFELADFIGLDIALSVMKYLYGELKDEKYKPSPTIEKLVKEGKLGRKTREGFFKYG
ncbi:MAG: 3-hydroxyacyl-CoA dehydrogenase family protein [Deltaproteobacteria bacterium]|nr:3-hydroxyacyl-CoA dehydrogenase family protein [Deltaproteobacteria bacterium]